MPLDRSSISNSLSIFIAIAIAKMPAAIIARLVIFIIFVKALILPPKLSNIFPAFSTRLSASSLNQSRVDLRPSVRFLTSFVITPSPVDFMSIHLLSANKPIIPFIISPTRNSSNTCLKIS